jgi:hypothetical protein
MDRRTSLDCVIDYLFEFFLQVTEEDQLPKIMCGECSYKLDLLSNFREKAYKTETHLLFKVDEANEVETEVVGLSHLP